MMRLRSSLTQNKILGGLPLKGKGRANPAHPGQRLQSVTAEKIEDSAYPHASRTCSHGS